VGVLKFANLFSTFLIDIPFKGCQGRSNRSSIVHAVSMTPHAPCIRCRWHRKHRAICVITTACIFLSQQSRSAYDCFVFENLTLHTVSLTPHASWMRCRIYNQEPRTNVLITKNRGSKISCHCPFKKITHVNKTHGLRFFSHKWKFIFVQICITGEIFIPNATK
jgi:hypothetical protein